MPPKKTFYKRKKKYGYKGKNYNQKRKIVKLNRTIPNVYHFNRSTTWSFNLATLSEAANHDTYYGPGFRFYKGDATDPQSAVCQYQFNMADLPDSDDFLHLFKYYKINGVSLKWYFSTGIGGGTTRDNGQMIMYTMPTGIRMDHTSQDMTELRLLQSQVLKKRLCLNDSGKPENYYMKVKQSRDTTDLQGNLRNVMVKPGWIQFDRESINNPGNITIQNRVPHYGITQRLQCVNGLSFPNIEIKIIAKYYFSCKQVR